MIRLRAESRRRARRLPSQRDAARMATRKASARLEACAGSSATRPRMHLARLDAAHHHENDQDEQHEPESPTWPVTPTGAVAPRGQRTDQQQNDDDEQDQRYRHTTSISSASEIQHRPERGSLFFFRNV